VKACVLTRAPAVPWQEDAAARTVRQRAAVSAPRARPSTACSLPRQEGT
jgi:hypothetical protein